MRKRLMTMFAAAALCVSAAAQGWQEVSSWSYGGGFAVGKAWEYSVKGQGSFVMRSWDEPRFCLVSDGGDFLLRREKHKYIEYVVASVGVELYDAKRVLTKSFSMALDYDSISRVLVPRNDAKKIPVPRLRSRIKAIFNTLRNGGYVCFTVRRPGRELFDLLVEPRREQ